MAENNEFRVEGYHFGTLEDAKQARLEKKEAEYFEARLGGGTAGNMLSVYNKILDEKVFTTPVGWEYVKQLQQRLRTLGVSEELIRPIPMYVTFVHEKQSVMDNLVRERVKPSRQLSKDKKNLRKSVFVNVVLGILVLAMFIITMKGSNPNILNYKKNITNQYASWEQELTGREKQLRQKENELGVEWIADEELYQEIK